MDKSVHLISPPYMVLIRMGLKYPGRVVAWNKKTWVASQGGARCEDPACPRWGTVLGTR